MATFVYTDAATKILNGTYVWVSMNINAALVDATYIANANHLTMADVPQSSVVRRDVPLTSLSFANSIASGRIPKFLALVAAYPVAGLLLYSKGANDAASPLIYYSADSRAMPFKPGGLNWDIQFDQARAGFFRVKAGAGTDPNPAPSLTSIAPTSVVEDGPDLTLDLFGSNFISTSLAEFNGLDLISTVWRSPSHLRATVPASLTATPGSYPVTVSTPGPGGGASSPQTFTVNPGITYAVWDTNTQSAGSLTLSNGNLTLVRTSLNDLNWRSIRATIGKSTGKWYWEVKYEVAGLNEYMVGFGTSSLSPTSYIGSGVDDYGWQSSGIGPLRWNNGGFASFGTAASNNDILMTALDMDNHKMWWGRNGTWFNSGDPVAGTNASFQGWSAGKVMYPAVALYQSGRQVTANFGQNAFSYTPPSGFNAGVF